MSEEQSLYRIEGRPPTIHEEIEALYFKRQPINGYAPGIYFLFNRDEIVYVGKSLWTMARIYSHERCKGKDFDSFTVLPFPAEQLDEKELEYICKFKPIYNTSLPPNPILKRKQGWATTLGIEVGVISKHIRKSKISPYVILRGRSYYLKTDMEALANG